MKKKLLIVADSAIPFLKGVLEPYCHVRYMEGAAISPLDVRDADALIIRTRTKCNAALLDGSTVKFIATATIGYDHIDTNYCRDHDIEVATSAGCNARGVLQYVMAALAALAARDSWRPADKTIGIVGVGNVGSAVERMSRALGFRVLCCDPPRMGSNPELGFSTLEQMLPECDIVTLNVPLNRDGKYRTENLADTEFFAQIKPGAIFINSSRGEVADEQALLAAFVSGKVSDAVIDTWRGEPKINPELLAKATLTTPHIAGYSIQGKAMGTAMTVRALSRKFSLGLDRWYPAGVAPSSEKLSISWDELSTMMSRYFDIATESNALKSSPEKFESLRDNYNFRNEFF